MRYFKLLASAVVAAAALMTFAGAASATTITVTTANETTDTVGKGAQVSAELVSGTEWILKSSFIGESHCADSTLKGEVTNAGSPTETVSGSFTAFTLASCNGTFTVLRPGTLELHTEGSAANGNGTLTWSGAEITDELSGIHCIFSTSNTDIGTVAGTHAGHVLLHIASASIPRTGGRSGALCGTSNTVSATYTFTNLSWSGSGFTNFTVD